LVFQRVYKRWVKVLDIIILDFRDNRLVDVHRKDLLMLNLAMLPSDFAPAPGDGDNNNNGDKSEVADENDNNGGETTGERVGRKEQKTTHHDDNSSDNDDSDDESEVDN
jgi:hypothetical protein